MTFPHADSKHGQTLFNPGQYSYCDHFWVSSGRAKKKLSLYISALAFMSSVASPKIQSCYANIFVFIDCENNQFLKK